MTDEQLNQEAVDVVGPGVLLQQARSRAGLSVEQIAGKLNLKPQNITDIEAENFDNNISVTFTRGYLKAYAKQVGVNEQQILEAFESLNACTKEPAKLQSFSRRVANQASDDRLMLVSYAILIVILGLFVVWWWQQDSDVGRVTAPELPAVQLSQQQVNTQASDEQNQPVLQIEERTTRDSGSRSESSEVKEPVTIDEASLSEPAIDLVSTSNEVTVGADDLSVTGSDDNTSTAQHQPFTNEQQTAQSLADDGTTKQADSLSSEGEVADVPETADVQRSDTDTADSSLRSAEIAETAVNNQSNLVGGEPVELVFEFADDCWMQLTDATGEAIAYGVKVQGRVMPVSGIPPFEVILGAPQVVKISYAGQTIDMTQFPKGRTARFNLPLTEEGGE